ncbi:MAG: tripartite tricarboxylate transporter substrate binding protein [Burkholderiales bacterium]|nr:tripartite tricarboxylate transporter substrate binding protein [Burkholderiales bacterium]
MARCKAFLAAALTVTLGCASDAAPAQEYPAKPVRVVVPFAPGGATDSVARLLMPKVGELAGGKFLVENRSGAGGAFGTEIVARAPADGYVLGVVNASHAVNPGLYPKLAYDALRDFSPVTLLASAPGVLVAHPSLKANNVRQLVALAKARPGRVHYASAGNGSPPHLAAVLFATLAGIRLTHVPYKGSSAAFTALAAGEVPVMFVALPAALPLVRGERARALAVTGTRRSVMLPGVPTVAESGVRGYDAAAWYGLIAPARTPWAVIERVHEQVANALALPATNERLAELGMEPAESGPADFAKHIESEIAKWRKVIAASGARAE